MWDINKYDLTVKPKKPLFIKKLLVLKKYQAFTINHLQLYNSQSDCSFLSMWLDMENASASLPSCFALQS